MDVTENIVRKKVTFIIIIIRVCLYVRGRLESAMSQSNTRMSNWFVHHVLQLKIVAHYGWKLFSASLTAEVQFVQSISVVLHSTWLTRVVVNVRFWRTLLRLHVIFTPTICKHVLILISFFLFSGAAGFYVQRSGFVCSSFTQSLPRVIWLGWLNVLTSVDDRRALVLVMQCPTSLCCCHTVSRHILLDFYHTKLSDLFYFKKKNTWEILQSFHFFVFVSSILTISLLLLYPREKTIF